MRRAALLVIASCVAAFPFRAEAGITLKKIHFPASMGGEGGPTTPPSKVPLSQTIAFEFDGTPSIPSGIAEGIRIRVDSSNTLGQTIGDLAYGSYSVDGKFVIFQPRLPTGAITDSFGPGSQNFADASLPGMLPNTVYVIDVLIGTPNSVSNMSKISSTLNLPLKFTTVDKVVGSTNVATYFSNAPDAAPKAKPSLSKPADGTTGVHPNTFNDPAGLFDSIPSSKKPPFKIRFKAPLNPSAENISSTNLRVRAILDSQGASEDVSVTADMSLSTNKPERADVLVFPQGVLPLGHTIVVEMSSKFQSLAGVAKDPSPDPATWKELVRYRVANDPTPGQPINDFILEDFDTTDHADTTIAAGGEEPASWDAVNSKVLKASFGFAGDGSLGRFEPPNDAHTINLDTDFQAFPLFDGSTPDVGPGAGVKGGVFNFTDFHLPANVTLVLRGNNPAIITCTGDCLIEGKIDLDGADGTDDVTFDSAIVAAPGGTGGAGGGRGGNGHPVVAPGGGQSLQYMQTPQFGQSGFAPGNTGPGGGGGGQCGCTLPWGGFSNDPNCTNYSAIGDGSRGSGGGGGSFSLFFPDAAALTQGVAEDPTIAVSGRRGAVGIGNHLPITFDPGKPIPNEPAAYQGDSSANDVATPNLNETFHQAYTHGGSDTGNGVGNLIYDKGPPYLLMSTSPTNWVNTTHVTHGGAAGPPVFVDSDPNNNFIFGFGEVKSLIGGQGGGGGGSRTEGLSQICKAAIFIGLKLPFTLLDAKGGGGGGAAGSLMVQALGTITLQGPKCRINATGGIGGGSEEISQSTRGGAAGAGSGGAIILMSATNVVANDPTISSFYTAAADKSVGGQFVTIDVSPGIGQDAGTLSGATTSGTTGAENLTLQVGDGAPGGPGIVQIHLPADAPDMIDETHFKANAKINRSVLNITTGLSDYNPLVDMTKTPSPLTSISVARSTWYDLGAVTSQFRPQINTTAGFLSGPLYGVPGTGPFFTGTDASTGLVQTDSQGNVTTPNDNDFEVDSTDLFRADYIPNGTLDPYYQTVRIRFQGADEDAANPGNPDLSTATAFVADPTQLNGKRFVRFEVTFDIATNPDVLPSPATPRPQMNFLRLPFKF